MQELLANTGTKLPELTDARKEKLGPDDAVDMARKSSVVIAAKGKKVVEVNIKKDDPSDEELIKMMIGPSGNLRAPTIRVGKKLFIGFNEEAIAEFLS